jgi:hypothetical protein
MGLSHTQPAALLKTYSYTYAIHSTFNKNETSKGQKVLKICKLIYKTPRNQNILILINFHTAMSPTLPGSADFNIDILLKKHTLKC